VRTCGGCASQLQADDSTRLELLLAPPADSSSAPYPAGMPDAAVEHSGKLGSGVTT